ncbi:hypothetical protein GCM10028828_05720 [Corynebacterium tapiri]
MKFFAEPLESDEDVDGFYDHELEGLKVLIDDVPRGHITAVTHAAGRTLLEVELDNGSTGMVPFVYDIVPEVDLEAQTVTVTPPDGLLEL